MKGFTRTRINRSDFKTNTLIKKPGCITTSSGIMNRMPGGLWIRKRLCYG